MLMRAWLRTDMLGMPFYYTVERSLGLLNDRKSSPYPPLKVSTSQSHTLPKKLFGLHLSFAQLSDVMLEPTPLFSDNQSAIALTKDHQYHPRTKHINIHFHFIRWIIENGSIHLIYCPTEDMLVDTLTKALPSPKVKHFVIKLGLMLV